MVPIQGLTAIRGAIKILLSVYDALSSRGYLLQSVYNYPERKKFRFIWVVYLLLKRGMILRG